MLDSGAAEERKLVSVLSCDLVGSTQRAERLDVEDVKRQLAPYFATVRAELERYGGTIEKFIGDEVFALFGAPRAHEDDPERAVRAALASLNALATLNAADPALDLHVRIGVTSGIALVVLGARPEAGEGMAWGDVANTAARIGKAAPVDGVLVDQATYEATRHVISYRATDPVVAKGKSQPVRAWRAQAPLARRGLDLALAEASRRALVDRSEEMATLEKLLAAAVTERRPHLVTLAGDPGIGKTWLVFELFLRVEAAHELVYWRHGRSSPYLGATYSALAEIVKGHAGILETDRAAVAARKLRDVVAELVRDPVEAARIESHLRPLAGLGGKVEARGNERGDAFAAWRHFLEGLARRFPLILVLEDIQWADDGLLDFVEYLVEWAKGVPILVVCTARSELLARDRGWGDKADSTTLVLEPLSTDESRQLVGTLAGETALPAEITEGIVRSAGGNPLYCAEYVRMLADRGLLGSPEAAATPTAAPALPVPESLGRIIASRLDALTLEEKELVQAGAVIGGGVWPGALSAIERRPRRWVNARLRTLEDKQLLSRVRRSAVEGEAEYGFHHALIRDVAYGGIPRRRRGEIHRRTAEWLESLSPDRAVDRAEMLAHHFVCAHDLARAAGDEPQAEELGIHARLALRDAGDRAASLYAFAAAAAFYRRALRMWPQEDRERPALLFRLGKALYYADAGGADELGQAHRALLAAGEAGKAAEAESFRAYLAHKQGRRDRASKHIERAAKLVGDLGPTRSKAEVLVDVANFLSLAGEHERTIVKAREALAIARTLRLRELEASALAMIGISRGLSGDLGGRDDLLRSIEIAEEAGSPLSAHCCGMLADLNAQMGDLESCFALQARARRHAERYGNAGFVRWLAAERVGECYWTGAWDEALERADAVIERRDFMHGYCLAMRGRIRLARGERERALQEDAGPAVAFARDAKDPQVHHPALAFGARAEAISGSRDRAEALADELLSLWRTNVDAYPVSAWAVDLMCALDALGRGSEFAQVARTVRLRTRWLDAVLAFASGDFAAAAEHFARIGSRPDEALARLRAAEALSRSGRDHAARAERRRAADFFHAVGAAVQLREPYGAPSARIARGSPAA